jgi:hypothetical protein
LGCRADGARSTVLEHAIANTNHKSIVKRENKLKSTKKNDYRSVQQQRNAHEKVATLEYVTVCFINRMN